MIISMFDKGLLQRRTGYLPTEAAARALAHWIHIASPYE